MARARQEEFFKDSHKSFLAARAAPGAQQMSREVQVNAIALRFYRAILKGQDVCRHGPRSPYIGFFHRGQSPHRPAGLSSRHCATIQRLKSLEAISSLADSSALQGGAKRRTWAKWPAKRKRLLLRLAKTAKKRDLGTCRTVGTATGDRKESPRAREKARARTKRRVETKVEEKEPAEISAERKRTSSEGYTRRG